MKGKSKGKRYRWNPHWHFLITSIFKSLYFLKWCPILNSSPLDQFSKFNNFLWICRFLEEQNSFQFCTPAWKLDNPYYHNMYMHWLDFIAYKNEIIRFTFGLLALFSTMFSSYRAVINKKGVFIVNYVRLPNRLWKFTWILTSLFFKWFYRVSHSEDCKVNQLWGVEGSIILSNDCA